MTRRLADHLCALDPRLKLGGCLVCGPCVWLLPPWAAAAGFAGLLFAVAALARFRPLGRGMVRRLLGFVLFWTAIKIGLDLLGPATLRQAVPAGLLLALRLADLLLLGLGLTLSTSSRRVGLAVVWALRPFVGRERAWPPALSLALMIHFLPLCLATQAETSAAFRRRCPQGSLMRRLTVVPLAVIRNLGRKTWNQTLAVAGRGLDDAAAWEPDFAWAGRDTAWLVAGGALLAAALLA